MHTFRSDQQLSSEVRFGCLYEASAEASCANAGSVAKVLLACDTRPSSPGLMAAAAAGVQALGGVIVDCGRLTTPQLHWQLRRLNQGLPWELKDYFSTMAGAYQQLVKGTEPLGQVGSVCPCTLPVPALLPCSALLPWPALPVSWAHVTIAPHTC